MFAKQTAQKSVISRFQYISYAGLNSQENKECEAEAIGKPEEEEKRGFQWETGFPLVQTLKKNLTPKIFPEVWSIMLPQLNCVPGHL